ncbi:GDP-mannose-dependent alpha-(1-2)-phosphatidylinositol mannosyltransferase [Corynebacterium kalinowskii]|uniref:GDP-mannose-dependent alpha-(1-2)-phosphatidylinositol mannosyltransferase n=1 Tax=Corynebacterium kalinowskii TaxID=2675216 RepID=A0A6B8VAI9_9CORY|nr:glycosyltransferase family 4 protein [Corynebacterium kalinowskii]QGU02152.1 GDP-mannose-dependent alpha-(1-2)-phosphatidylinositol mannosyltransferase [Corynebacterium kalinowskii]
MRIGIVCPYSFDQPGGVQAHILDLAEYLRGQGHFVQVIGPASNDIDLPGYVVKGGPSVAVPYNGSVARLALGPRVSRQLKQFIAEGQFDVLHIHEPNAPSYSLQAMALAQGPIVATYHASASESLVLRVAAAGLRPMLEKIRGGIAVSEMARRWQVEQLGGDPVLIPNGVDTQLFATTKPRRNDPLEVVFLGRIDEPRKGLDILLDALQEVNAPCHVTVMGGGTPRDISGVSFVGRVSEAEKVAYLQAADIYVAPNTGGESFGIVLVEAMAAGAVVVASDIEAFRHVLQTHTDEPAGMVFRNEDAHDLARALTLALTDSELRTRLRERGLQRAAVYDWARVGADILRVYETVADGTIVHVKEKRR